MNWLVIYLIIHAVSAFFAYGSLNYGIYAIIKKTVEEILNKSVEPVPISKEAVLEYVLMSAITGPLGLILWSVCNLIDGVGLGLRFKR